MTTIVDRIGRAFVEPGFTRPIGLLVRKGKYLSRASQAVLDSLKRPRAAD